MANPWTTNNPFEPPRDDPQAAVAARQNLGDITWVLTSFEGRIPRRTYWMWTLLAVLAFYAVLFGIAFVVDSIAPGTNLDFLTLLILLLYVPMIWVNLALQVKRCHDRDRSGWFVLVAFIPLVGSFILFVDLGLLRGTEGRNTYGPDPT